MKPATGSVNFSFKISTSIIILVLWNILTPHQAISQKVKWGPGVVGYADFEANARAMRAKVGGKVEFGSYETTKLPFFSIKKTQNVPTEPSPNVNYVKTQSGKILQYGATDDFAFNMRDSLGGQVIVQCSATESNRMIQTSIGQTGVLDATKLSALNFMTELTNTYVIKFNGKSISYKAIQGVDGKIKSYSDRNEPKTIKVTGDQITITRVAMKDKEIKRDFDGYLFKKGEAVVAAVHVVGFKRTVWIRNDLSNAQKLIFASLSAALLLEPNTEGDQRLSPAIPKDQLLPLLLD